MTFLPARGAALASLIVLLLFGSAVAEGASKTNHGQWHATVVRCHHGKKKHHRCPHATKHSKKKATPAPTPAATTPPPSTEPSHSPPPPPPCPQTSPLPAIVPGQTTIVGYATTRGAPAPQQTPCPSIPAGGTVVLETTAGQTLQSQAVSAGQPYQFIVQPGEYLVADALCPEIKGPVTAIAGQQTRADVACDIP
jgi:hypothetical protein